MFKHFILIVILKCRNGFAIFLVVAFKSLVFSLLDRRYIENVYYSTPTRWPFFLLIPFFIILCVLIATLVKVYFQKKNWRTEDYTSDGYINFIFKIHYFCN